MQEFLTIACIIALIVYGVKLNSGKPLNKELNKIKEETNKDKDKNEKDFS